MAHIKRLVMHGFKSFANKTEINFHKGINVVVGPNGSGKSNISDALTFALGRLSAKSMRAAKAKNLLFMGTKDIKPAKEAYSELVFDNLDKSFGIDAEEVALKRIVRNNGQSIYKINNDVKTRTEVIETLAQAGIDPYGYNMILQGQIQSITKMHPEERRKIIEEVGGISIYESRKEKSLHELEKTEEKLKEIGSILRERSAYLRNLEKEREQALRFKDLEVTIKRCKASILDKKINDKTKEIESARKAIEEKTKERDKLKNKEEELNQSISELNEKISNINKLVQKSAGIERDVLNEQIRGLRTEVEVLKMKKENYESKILEFQRKIEHNKLQIPELENEILSLKQKSPMIAKKQEELKKKKEELEKIEEEKKRIYTLKTELNNLKERIREKEISSSKISGESDNLMRELEFTISKLQYPDLSASEKAVKEHKSQITNLKKESFDTLNAEFEKTKIIASLESDLKNAEKIMSQIKEIDVCPLCLNKMTEQHMTHVLTDSENKISSAKKEITSLSKEIEQISKKKKSLSSDLAEIEKKLMDAEREQNSHRILSEKQAYLKKLVDNEALLKKEIKELEARRETLERKAEEAGNVEELYTTKLHEIQEISSRTENNLDYTLSMKELELEKFHESIKTDVKNVSELKQNLEDYNSSLQQKSEALQRKQEEEVRLQQKFKQLFEDRDKMQIQIQEMSIESSSFSSDSRQLEDQINSLIIANAGLQAQKEMLDLEFSEHKEVELIKAPMQNIEERLQKAMNDKNTIGSINMRALEVYDEIKVEYEKVQEKVDTLNKEKEEIMSIIAEIDSKKKRTFMRTFNAINQLFSENFSKLYTKGVAYLEIENPESIFEGGINIVIKLGKGKFFDVTSLSGGEQTLVAISLLFAIQEHKPYSFYIFDEIDAALDKRNSERLSALLKQYMQSGQYIVVTHNDALILDSNVLYGVSMHDGVSKILSLNVAE